MSPPTSPKVTDGSIVILDCGGQYAHLIANRVRRLGAFSEVRIAETPAEDLKGAAGIILSGGPQSVYEDGSPHGDPKIFELGIPVLGICYGHQWIAHVLGGRVVPGLTKEYGHTDITITKPDTAIFKGLPQLFTAWMSHGDEVADLPAGFVNAARSATCENAAMVDEARRIYGTQFHLEVTHTQHGMEILEHFVRLCDAAPWSVENYAERIQEQIRREVGDRKVFMLVSGGVDSTVAFTLLNQVLGKDRVQGLLIDTGLMRKNEILKIQEALGALTITNLRVEDASEEFFEALDGIMDPEEKRKKIGETFLSVQKRMSEEMDLKMEDGWLLGQGTIYPDTIETGGTKHADHIKTHHNRVTAIQKMIERGLIVEPLKDLYKDEVRTLGEELGLPHDLVWRHPFPGPGLGVRILCAASPSPLSVIDPAMQQRIDQITQPHFILPIRSVGVQGDGRTYRHAMALFAYHPCRISPEHRALTVSIPNTIPVINRVLLCISCDEAPRIVFSPGGITRDRADLLREADAIVDEEMRKAGLTEKIWQFPVVLLPFGLMKGGQSIVLRPISSTDAMTANAVILDEDVLQRMTDRLMCLPGIEIVFVDLTNKPPGTIEWE